MKEKVQYKVESVVGQVYAFLTSSEIENLAKQEYVSGIMENQGIERLNRD